MDLKTLVTAHMYDASKSVTLRDINDNIWHFYAIYQKVGFIYISEEKEA